MKSMEQWENEKAGAVREVAEHLMKILAERLEERLVGDPKLVMTIKVELNLDWPYEIAVDLSASSSVYSAKDLERAITEVLEEGLKHAEEMLKNRGLRPLP
ncbi:MAG: hypothetical protein QW650_06730 [Thermofilum sp.]